MKPYLLRLQAFGPFSSKQEVCFDDVFSGGLFLIHGRTGAGKTSLLDGLCFSLFGRPSTPEREKDLRALRSDLAPPELLTESELVFAIGLEVFKVHRVPSQTVPKKRGEGTTEFKGSAELWRLHVPWPATHQERLEAINLESNWTPIAAKQEAVDREIELILGMNERQFRQVVILPQGKFREFLSSSSAERQTILERLFQTDRFSRFQTFLSQHHKQLEQKWKSRTDFVISRLQNFGIENVQALPQEIQSRETNLSETNRTLVQVREMEKSVTQLLHRLEALEQDRTRLAGLEQAAQTLKENANAIAKMKIQVQAHDRLIKYLAIRDSQDAANNRLLGATSRAEDLRKRLGSLKAASETSIRAQKTLLEKKPTLDELRNEYQRLKLFYATLRDLLKELVTKEQDVLQLERSINDSRSKITYSQQTLTLGASTYLALQAKHGLLVESEVRTIEEALRATKTLELHYHAAQAAALAAELKAGEPCPVCGSLEHPAPVSAKIESNRRPLSKEDLELARQKSQSAIDEIRLNQERRTAKLDQLKSLLSAQAPTTQSLPDLTKTDFNKSALTLEQDLIKAQNTVREATATIAAMEPRLEESRKRLQELRQTLEDVDPAERDLATVAKKGTETKAEIDTRESESERLRQQIAEEEKRQAEIQGQLSSTEDEIQSAKSEADELSLRLHAELKNAGFADGPPADLIQKPERDRLEKSISEHEAKLTQTEGAHKEALERVRIARAKIEEDELLKTQADATLDLAKTKAKREELDNQVRALEAQAAKLKIEIENLQKLQTEVEKEETELAAIREESDRTIRLTALVTGDRSQNKLSVPLSRFVLQSRFEDVLDQANRRLGRMSRGRYLLRRPALSRNLAQSQGLNLSVEDAVTGKERHADSLSGGESFMAALSLALGLADVVQNNLGGVRLDSVLIDEGFGTLDAESLDLALRTLIDLQAGGRMVGVISHVQELKSQIDRRLELLATPQGSRIRWENGAHVSSRYETGPGI